MAYRRDGKAAMYYYEASQTITINTQNAHHALIGMTNSATNGAATFKTSLTGSITSTANNGGVLRCTDAAHGLDTGDYITLNGMGDAAHNGVTGVTVVDTDTFDCDDITYNSAADTGSWQRGSSLTINSGYGGRYSGGFSFSASSAVASKDYRFQVYANTTAFTEFVWERLFGNTGLGVGASAGVGTLKSGDVIWVACINTTDTQDVVIEHGNLAFTK